MLSRTATVFWLNFKHSFRRPLFWVLIVALALTSFGLSSGNLSISSGDSSVGGTKAWVNSQFAVAQMFTLVSFLFYSFFVVVAAGMAVIRDEELQVVELQHSTSLRAGEYVWGKFSGILASFLVVLALHVLFVIFFFQFFPTADAAEIRGPFELLNYLVPALLFALPTILFFAGTSFAVGEVTRRPMLVFVLPVAFFLFCIFFLWQWSPTWLDPRINKLLMVVDPAGFRWLSETWLTVDRGVDFYNEGRIGLDRVFGLNRLLMVAFAFLSVAWSRRHFARSLGGDRVVRRRFWHRGRTVAGGPDSGAEPVPVTADSLSSLGMSVSPPGLFRGIWEVMRVELRELKSQPGLYLFAPLILLQTLGTSLSAVGGFGEPILLTSGRLAVGAMNTLTLLVCLLLCFYTVESLERERSTGFNSIFYATPLRTASALFGKALANSVVGVVILLSALIASAIALLVQGKVPFEMGPFLLVWGVLLVPTFLVWSAFVTGLLALIRERYTTYALALAALIATGYFQATGKMTWVWNWDLWGVLRWSDMGSFELDRVGLVLNRVMVLGLTVFFTAVSVRLFGRQDLDVGRALQRLHPRVLWKPVLRLAPFAVVPLVAGSVLAFQVRNGFQGEVLEKEQKDYWQQNLATWREAPLPDLEAIELDLELVPEERHFRIAGTYRLRNHRESALARIPLTGSPLWEDLAWTLDGESYEPEDRSALFVFSPSSPLAPGEGLEIGFRYHGVFPAGITKNGGGASQFLLNSGIVLHNFGPTFAPVLGYLEGIGVDPDENRYEPRVYPDDHYKGVNEPFLGSATPFRTRVKVTAPVEYTVNSVGTRVSETVEGRKKTVVWESEYPVKILNVVAGKWDVRRGEGTAVFYHPEHTYNVDEISGALEAARKYYSQWFYPFPWEELKLSEFPALATYAQGFPTNITFSEGIGFLTRSDPKTNEAFLVTAHEAAHQWWGNLVTPARGPGGNILSEGMSHYSTTLLIGEVKGERDRIEFCKRLEERYGDRRQVDSERPLVKIDGSRSGDTTVTYDKGGWVMWMLTNLMGREAALEGLRQFVAASIPGPDHPLLEDLVESLRPFAPDPAAYDAFVKQWYFDVVVPEYRLSDAELVSLAGEAPQAEGSATGWKLRLTVTNEGSGQMPVEVAAQLGDRYTDEGDPAPEYREVRTTLLLGAGESQEVEIDTDFEPDRVIVDPDAKVLQLNREAALVRL